MENKNGIKVFTIASIVFLIVSLGILATGQIDYNISKALINRDSIWAEFFNIFGETPAVIGLLMGTSILFLTRRRENKVWFAFATLVGGFFVLVFSNMLVSTPVRYIFEFSEDGTPSTVKTIVKVVALVIAITIFIVGPRYKDKLEKVRREGLFMIVLVASTIVLVNVLKIIWGRPRMRSISSFEEFNYWYQIAGPAASDEFKSFPSGHTANGFCILMFYVLTPYIKLFKPNTVLIFGVIWGAFVALSRVVLGAHFLSDVLVGGYVAIFLFLIYNHLFFVKWAKK